MERRGGGGFRHSTKYCENAIKAGKVGTYEKIKKVTIEKWDKHDIGFLREDLKEFILISL